MTIQITEPGTPAGVPVTPFADTALVAEALAELVRMFGHLPMPYITFPSSTRVLSLQADSPSAFEAWRTALQIGPDDVALKEFGGDAWLSTAGVFRGVTVELTGFGLRLPAEAVAA
ncbi:hypothetical protein ACF1AE_25435 [Streptomyces sp. NPDC014986]|uniref:hypothetical protein n=1 Tax=Streptomyces sp. NPDC014986 TaxID=3364934 RepID=UPI0036F97B64